MIRIMLVDDHSIVRTGLRGLLEDKGGFKVVAEAGDGEKAVQLAKELEIDVILMDLQMPGLGGIEATRKIIQHNSYAKIIVLTSFSENPFPKRLLDVGASGYLTKGCAAEELLQAIKIVHSGQKFISPEIAQKIALGMMGGDESPFDALSAREMEVMMMLLQGEDNAPIAKKLSLSPKTVSTYRYRVYEKLGVQNDVGMVKLAIIHGILDNA